MIDLNSFQRKKAEAAGKIIPLILFLVQAVKPLQASFIDSIFPVVFLGFVSFWFIL
jgi:hypothetical protein